MAGNQIAAPKDKLKTDSWYLMCGNRGITQSLREDEKSMSLVGSCMHIGKNINEEFEREQEADNTCFVSPDESVQGSEEIELFGYCSSVMGKSFEVAQKVHWKSRVPCILFVDEIDRQREVGLRWEDEEREQTLHQLLTEMDGFTGNVGVSVLAATNRSGDYLFKNYHDLMFVGGKRVENGRRDDDTFGVDVQKVLESIHHDKGLLNQPKKMKEVAEQFGMWEWPQGKKASSHFNFRFKSRLWKFDMWEWRKRKKEGGNDCKFKYKKWNFDIWRWPLRKKEGRTNVESYMDRIGSLMCVH